MTLEKGIGQPWSTLAFMLVLCGGGLQSQVHARCSGAIYPGRMLSDIGAGALLSARMLVLHRLTLDLVWRHLELDPLTGYFARPAGIGINLRAFF